MVRFFTCPAKWVLDRSASNSHLHKFRVVLYFLDALPRGKILWLGWLLNFAWPRNSSEDVARTMSSRLVSFRFKTMPKALVQGFNFQVVLSGQSVSLWDFRIFSRLSLSQSCDLCKSAALFRPVFDGVPKPKPAAILQYLHLFSQGEPASADATDFVCCSCLKASSCAGFRSWVGAGAASYWLRLRFAFVRKSSAR